VDIAAGHLQPVQDAAAKHGVTIVLGVSFDRSTGTQASDLFGLIRGATFVAKPVAFFFGPLLTPGGNSQRLFSNNSSL
jgi:hypothetical protein